MFDRIIRIRRCGLVGVDVDLFEEMCHCADFEVSKACARFSLSLPKYQDLASSYGSSCHTPLHNGLKTSETVSEPPVTCFLL